MEKIISFPDNLGFAEKVLWVSVGVISVISYQLSVISTDRWQAQHDKRKPGDTVILL